jgi:hypothetical protein
MDELVERLNRSGAGPFVLRTHGEVSRFFDGLEMVEPGLVQVDDWRPSDEAAGHGVDGGWVPAFYGGVGRKP